MNKYLCSYAGESVEVEARNASEAKASASEIFNHERGFLDLSAIECEVLNGPLTDDQIRILCVITNHDEAGRHFTDKFDADDLIELETRGLIEVNRPIHEPTGIMFDRDQWSVEVTEDGEFVVNANPEIHPR